MKIQHTLLAAIGCLCLLTTALPAPVPNLLNYQGRVAVGDPSVNFDGTGQFKFALVTTRNSVQATATAVVNNGSVLFIVMTNVGAGYPPGFIPVNISGGGGSGAAAIGYFSNGSVFVQLLFGGGGYTAPPTVTIDPPPTATHDATLWSHDGSS